jgi:DNA replication protein DnaC
MAVDHEALVAMLTRLKLTAIRDGLDSLLDEAARRDLTLREALAFLCNREVARKDERRIEMALKIAHFPCARELDGFDFAAQPSLDPHQIRELATSRWIAHGDALLLLGPPGVGKSQVSIAMPGSVPRGSRRGVGFVEVIADRARSPARRGPGYSVDASPSDGAPEALRDPQIVSAT